MDNNEKTRRNLKVNSTQHAFMVERVLAKENYQKKCKAVKVDAAGKVAIAKQIFEAEQIKINATADEACAKAQMEYFDQLADIAQREDAFKHEIAEYIASLQPAVNPGGGIEQ